MPNHLNSVKTSGEGQRYHHGSLPDALIEAAEAVIAERGVDGFSLREAARRAGVSPAAPQHHFGDARGLLTALATRGFQNLADALAEADSAAGPSPAARLRAQGAAYVRFALARPSQFDIMWRTSRIDGENAACAEAGRRAFSILQGAFTAPGEEYQPSPADPRAIACWSMVHGFARLALDGAFQTPERSSLDEAERMLEPMLASLALL